MAMTWDSPLVTGVAAELHELLKGSRLRAHLFEWDRRRLTLYFRGSTLSLCLHPEEGWILVHPPRDPPENARPLSAEVRGVEAPPDERHLTIQLRKSRGKVRAHALVVELMTNQWNALLLEGDEGRIRHLLWTRRLPERTLSVGEAYRPPTPSTRRGVGSPLTSEEWADLVGEIQEPASLLAEIAFTSPINLSALLAQGGKPSPSPEKPLAGYALWKRLSTLEDPAPHLLESERGKQCYPFLLHGFNGTRFPSIMEAMAAQAGGEGEDGQSPEELLQRARKALGRARGRARGLRRELEEAEDPDEPRDRANLILARLGEISPGMERVRLEGFGGETVELSLDPSRSPQENAADLYDEAARRERAREALPELLEEAEENVRELERLLEGLGSGVVAAGEAEERLPRQEAPRGQPGGKPFVRLPYRRFRSSGGLEIRVGRRGSDNDDLTFHHARPDHIWLHAREVQGAHVVLCWEGEGNPPARDLTEAATLAALNSRARNAGVVPVDWTRRKYVRKPRKAPPGSVVPDRVQTLFVEPAPELEKRLAWED